MTTSNDTLLISDSEGVRTITLNRTARRNALDSALGEALLHAMRAADQDPTVGAVLLAGNGPIFCSGADLGEFKGHDIDPAALEKRGNLFLDLQLIFEDMRVPVVCAVIGAAIGAGGSLAVASDFTVMGESSRLAWPEMAHGMVPTLVMAHLQRRVGRKLAFELLALGEPLPAQAALAMGLTNRVVPDAEVMDKAFEVARVLASRDRSAMRETKELFIRDAHLPLPEALRAAREAGRLRQRR